MDTKTGSRTKPDFSPRRRGIARQMTIPVTVPRELVEEAALMATRFEIEPAAFIRHHVTAGAVSTLGIASENIEWTPEDYPFANREAALRAVRVVFEESRDCESHQISYLRKGKMVYEEACRADAGLAHVTSRENRTNRKQEVNGE